MQKPKIHFIWSFMKKIFIVLLLATTTGYTAEVAKLSIDNGNYTLELPYLELVTPNDAYTAVLTSSDGGNFVLDYSTVRQLPLNYAVDRSKLTQLSISANAWFLELPYLEEFSVFGTTKTHSATFYSYTGEVFIKIGDFYTSPSTNSTYVVPKEQNKCDGRVWCSEMTSCSEAKYFIKNCPGTKMDGDNDGIPCERQWCGY